MTRDDLENADAAFSRRHGGLTSAGDGEFAYAVAMIAATPRDLLVDQQGRPYFLWDVDMTLDEFERRLRESDPVVRAYLVGKLMRQAKPDDVLQFVSPQELADLWPSVDRYLGKTRAFWTWLLEKWEAGGYIRR